MTGGEARAGSDAWAWNHAARFDALDRLLTVHAHLWQIRPFHHRAMVWHESHPDLCEALQALSNEELTWLEADARERVQWLAPWLGNDGEQLLNQSRLAPVLSRAVSVPPRFDNGIPGRKWQQVEAFAAVLPAEQRPLLEWCAGKGHLGRLLAKLDGRTVTSLEWQSALCREGQQAADQVSLPVRFVQADVYSPHCAGLLPAAGQAVALHACGDLHTTLMRHWVASHCHRLTLSPCCYHLIQTADYQPLSARAGASALRLARLDLQLPVRQIATGGKGAERKRRVEVLWRLAFDEWQREQRESDHYLPLPTFPKALLMGHFEDFVRWAAVTKGLRAPRSLDERHWLQRGEIRLSLVRRMELVSRLFRRPLEIWLALDRALYLEEHGAHVRLGTFCDWEVTPRNIVIDAQRGVGE